MRSLLVILFIFSPTAFGQERKPESSTTEKSATTEEKPTTEKKPEPVKKSKVSMPPKVMAKAPERFRVQFDTSKGKFVVDVHRKWAPNGADHFYNLVKSGYYDNNRFFRVLPTFVVQWGLNGNPASTYAWRKPIKDDPVVASNMKGFITFAKTGAPNSRTTQLFLNMADNQRLDGMGFAPFGKVVTGMDVASKFYAGYGAEAQSKQGTIRVEGNKFLQQNFPKLDYIKTAKIIKPMDKKGLKAPVKDGETAPASATPEQAVDKKKGGK